MLVQDLRRQYWGTMLLIRALQCFTCQARGEEQEEDSDVSSRRSASDDGEPDLLELLLKHAERAPSRSVEPRLFSLDLRSDFPISSLRGLLPCHSVPFLNALVQTLLASSLKALLSQVSLTPVQRPAYSCFAQLCLEMEGSISKPSDLTSLNLQNIQNRPVDAGLLMEPLLRRFERGKSVQEAPAFPGPSRVPGLADMFSCFLHFFLGQLHDECKWPSVRSVSSSQQDSDDSPMMRIFGGLIQTSKERRPKNAKATDVAFESFLLLHLDLTPSSMALTSVSKALGVVSCFRTSGVKRGFSICVLLGAFMERVDRRSIRKQCCRGLEQTQKQKKAC